MQQELQTRLRPQDFKLELQIGTTKFGPLYPATQIKTQTPVIIKILIARKHESPEMYLRLKNEIEIHSRLKHPNIEELYCYMYQNGRIYLVFEHYDKSFIEMKMDKTFIPIRDVARYMWQLLHALEHLGKRSIIHRDIKMENLHLSAKGNLKLANFQNCIHTKTESSSFAGTTEYMAPEIACSKPYNQKVDVYSAGIVFYELFYWSTPFEKSTEAQTLEAVKQNQFKFMENVRTVPESAKQLILNLLAKDPKKRPTPEEALQNTFFKEHLK